MDIEKLIKDFEENAVESPEFNEVTEKLRKENENKLLPDEYTLKQWRLWGELSNQVIGAENIRG